jgi:outer membrane protein assembly factor BamB
MSRETLEDHLRRVTRNFTSKLPEDDVLVLGRRLAEELARAHAESPPRHPDLALAAIPMVDGKPTLGPGAGAGSVAEDLFQLGALLQWLATGREPDVSWLLDGPPAPELSTLTRRAALAGLTAPAADARLSSAVTAVAALSAALAPESGGPPAWPLFRGEPGRAGYRPAATAAVALAPVWDAPVGGVTSSPLLAGPFVIAAAADGRLLFLDRATGRRVHEQRVGSALESTPALSGGRLHVGTDDGDLVGIDVRDGREVYRARLGTLVRSSPLPLDDRVLVGVVEGKTAGGVTAVEPEKGKPLWKRKLGAVFSSPALAGGRVLVGSDDGSLHALDPGTGALLWSHRLGAKVRATPAASGDLAVVGDFEGRLMAVRVADGTPGWVRQLGQGVYSSPCLVGDLCVVGCHDGSVHGFRLANGEPVFKSATRGPVVSSPAALGERLLVGSTDGDLCLLDSTGAILARASLSPLGTQSSPALDGEGVVIGSARGLHAFRVVA